LKKLRELSKLNEGQSFGDLFTSPTEAQQSGLLSAGLSLLASDPTMSLSQRVAGAIGSGVGALKEARQTNILQEQAQAAAQLEQAKGATETAKTRFDIFGKGTATTAQAEGTPPIPAIENQFGELVDPITREPLGPEFTKASGKGVTVNVGEEKDTALRDIFARRLEKDTEKINTADQQLQRIRQARSLADRLDESDFGTGAEARQGIAKAALFLSQATGIELDEQALNERIAAGEGLKTLEQEFIQPFFDATKGSISNTEVKMFLSAVPRLMQSKAGFGLVTDYMEATQERFLRRTEFFEDYFAKVEKPMYSKANRIWGQYIRDNDVLQEREGGGFKIDRGAVDSDLWMDYTSSQGRPEYQLEGKTITMSDIRQTAEESASRGVDMSVNDVIDTFKRRGMVLSGQSIR
jgi:hypothetical protein